MPTRRGSKRTGATARASPIPNGAPPSSSARQLAREVKQRKEDRSLSRQFEIPLYILLAIGVMHALSSSAALHSINLLPHSLQNLLPSWVHALPQLSPYDADVPNASHDYTSASARSRIFSAGPFKSDAAGFGHPLTALHLVTRAFLGLSYQVPGSVFGAAAQKLRAHSPWDSATGGAWQWVMTPANKLYGKGPADALFVLTWIFAWTAIRAAVMKYLLIPLGNRWVIKHVPPKVKERSREAQLRAESMTRKAVIRFAEQGWCVVFYLPSLSLSLWVASRQPYWPLKTEHLWIGYPHAQIDGLTKFYYLAELGFWLHQIFVLNVEEKRKDYEQMFAHHIVTVALIISSYYYNYTRIGNMILVLMDPSDILLSAAKCLRYVGQQTLCDIGFGLFLLSWIITRHALYLVLIWSAAFESQKYIARAWIPEQGWYYTDKLIVIFVGMLSALQVILCLWFVMIARVAYRVVTGRGANDSRSDDESEDEDAPHQPEEVQVPVPPRESSANALPPASTALPARSSSIAQHAPAPTPSKRRR